MTTIVCPAAIYVGPNGDMRRDVWIKPVADDKGNHAGLYGVHVRNPLDPDGDPIVIEKTANYAFAEQLADHWNHVEF